MNDVVIIGGGPVGSRVACGLAGCGHDVVVLEKKGDPGEQVCCTGIIGTECVERFDIDDNVIFRRANSAAIYSPSGKLLHVERREPQAAIVDRAAFNVLLAKRAQDRGAKYILNSPVSDIEVRGDKVTATAGDISYEARVAVIASGFGSKLVEEAGMGRPGDFAMGAQAEVETSGVEEVEVYLGKKIAPGFFAWLVPTSPGRALAGLISRTRTGYHMKKLISSLLVQGRITTAELEVKYAGVALKALSRTSGDRVIAVGSAAGQVKPTTGGGIYYGLLCADIAADSLHRALESDNLSAKSLANYDRRWKRVLGREQKLGYWSRKFFEILNDRQIDRILDIIMSSGIDKALLQSEDLSFDWHGRVILKLVGHSALSRVVKSAKLPFPVGKKD